MYPSLMEDLPMMLISLDNNNVLNLNCILNDELRNFVVDIMQDLKLELTATRGWSKSQKNESIRQKLVDILINSKSISHPNELSSTESASFRLVLPKVMRLIHLHPDLKFELNFFFENIIDGNEIDLKGIENEIIGEELSKLLLDLGLEQNEDEEYFIPKGSNFNFVFENIRHLSNVFRDFDLYNSSNKVNNKTEIEKISKKNKKNKKNKKYTSSSSSEEQEEESDEISASPVTQQPIGPTRPSSEPIGPTRPSADLLMLDNEVSSGEEAGPQLREAPAGGEWSQRSSPRPASPASSSAQQEGGRELWMIDPGMDRSVANGALLDTFGVSRKFNTGKEAKKRAASYVDAREQFVRSRKIETEDVSREVSKKPSLMEEHTQRLREGGSGRGRGDRSEPRGRRAFDREEDVLSHRKMTATEATELVNQCKMLNDRFAVGF